MTKKLHDRIFAVGGALMCLATIPAAFGQIHSPIWSAALVAGVLLSFAVNYLTMHYYLAAATVLGQALLWTAIIIRAIH